MQLKQNILCLLNKKKMNSIHTEVGGIMCFGLMSLRFHGTVFSSLEKIYFFG